MKNYNIAIIGGHPSDLDIIDEKIMSLCEEKEMWLFNLYTSSKSSLGYLWAEKRGCPVIFTTEEWQLWKNVDYIFFIFRNEQSIRNAIMKAKNLGLHGTVIRREE
jgi:hypothetical protein